MEAATFIAVWEAWQAKPGHPQRAGAMEDACHAMADDVLGFRRHLSAQTRAGRSKLAAIESWRDPVVDQARLDVFGQIVSCTRCELHAQCNGPVPFRGNKARIAIIGEAPGNEEDLAGKPFVGPSGQLVDELLHDFALTEEMGVLNTVSCAPHGTPTWDHVNACAENKRAQLEYLDPTWVLLLGQVALKAVRPDLAIKGMRGRPFMNDGRIHFATYHPAAALRNGNYRAALEADLETFGELVSLGPERWTECIPDKCVECLNSAVWFGDEGLGWCRLHLPSAYVDAFEGRHHSLVAEREHARAGKDLARFAEPDPGAAQTARAEAIAGAEASIDPQFAAASRQAIEWLVVNAESFTADDIWEWLVANAPDVTTREPAALGAVVLSASREGIIVKTGEQRPTRHRHRHRDLTVWAAS
jgi:uracil-DNA glycosylase family 4